MIKAVLDDATAARLEDADIGFVDGAGRAWLPGQTLTKRVRERLPAPLAHCRRLRWTYVRLAPGAPRPAGARR
jgi:hypothetical protein